jgi:hypothetical protein
MTTVAYIANQFPSSIEPYVMDEIDELRSRGVGVVCCSGKRVRLGLAEERVRAFWDETRFFQPLSDTQLVWAARRLSRHHDVYSALLKPLLRDLPSAPLRRMRSLGHTVLGAALAEELGPLGVEHIHAHHGYFASWMALVAAHLLQIGFSFTLHGSDLFSAPSCGLAAFALRSPTSTGSTFSGRSRPRRHRRCWCSDWEWMRLGARMFLPRSRSRGGFACSPWDGSTP